MRRVHHVKRTKGLHVIDDAGHVPHIERPAAFMDALRTALGTTGRLAALTAETEER